MCSYNRTVRSHRDILPENLKLFGRLPQTWRIFFGGSHDAGYLPSLNSLRTEGSLNKLVILKSYIKMAVDVERFIKETTLDTVTVPGLFLGHKMGAGASPQVNITPKRGSPPTSPDSVASQMPGPSESSSNASSASTATGTPGPVLSKKARKKAAWLASIAAKANTAASQGLVQSSNVTPSLNPLIATSQAAPISSRPLLPGIVCELCFHKLFHFH